MLKIVVSVFVFLFDESEIYRYGFFRKMHHKQTDITVLKNEENEKLSLSE